MPLNSEGQPVLSNRCPARGDYGKTWTMRPRDFHVNGLPGAEEGEDTIDAGFGRTKRDQGHVWRYTDDIGDDVPEAVGSRIRALDYKQVTAVGAILCGRVAECTGAQIDKDGFRYCPALNFETFMEAVDQVRSQQP